MTDHFGDQDPLLGTLIETIGAAIGEFVKWLLRWWLLR
jgi:hypothetical protein